MDKAMRTVPGVVEAGIDTTLSHTNACFYVKLYDGSYDVAGFESIEEAYDELLYAVELKGI